MSQVYSDNSQSIGNTPLVKINNISSGIIYAKIESKNPTNSVKCRIGANMIWAAEKEGTLKPGMEIVEPTSGNTGIALAFVAASRSYAITLTMPNTMSLERRQLMKSLGANVVLSNWLGIKYFSGSWAMISSALAIAPGMPFAPSDKTTLAPRDFINWRRSRLMVLGMVKVIA